MRRETTFRRFRIMTAAVETQIEIKPRTFYSPCANLQIVAGKPKRIMVGGEMEWNYPPEIQFMKMGAESFGRFVTTDPKLIEFLENRMKNANDVFEQEEYDKRTIPADKRNDALKSELSRQVDSNNRLLQKLAELEQKNAEAKTQGAQPLTPPISLARK